MTRRCLALGHSGHSLGSAQHPTITTTESSNRVNWTGSSTYVFKVHEPFAADQRHAVYTVNVVS